MQEKKAINAAKTAKITERKNSLKKEDVQKISQARALHAASNPARKSVTSHEDQPAAAFLPNAGEKQ